MRFAASLVLCVSLAPAQSGPSSEVVASIFKTSCFECHGSKTRMKDLDLSSVETALLGAESGPVVVAGKPEESQLYKMVRSGVMPLGKPRLNESDIAIMRSWIESLAPRSKRDDLSQHDVVPILLARCGTCHGGRRQEGGLDLRTRASMLAGGKSGPALMPGNPDGSLLIRKIHSGEMPPKERMLEVSVRPITKSETQKLARWIALGAPESSMQPDVAGVQPDTLVTDDDRRFWAFQPPQAMAQPKVRNSRRVRNPVDSFVLRKLGDKGLSRSPEADRLTLIRRATFDLTGLPPEPEEVKTFVADPDPRAYEKLIDRLLASPRYGERWAQYWLDAAGYSDSEGKLNSDPIRPVAFRYRDYVIRSFNADKPYDRFLLEQLAGDELEDYENAPTVTAQLMDNLIATGFLRMAPDATNQRDMNFLDDRHEVIADSIDIFSSTVLGLTLNCARCHNHKYDPFPQRDYFRLADIFKGAYDEHDWLAPTADKHNAGRHLPYVTPGATPMQALRQEREREEHNSRIEDKIATLRTELKDLAAKFSAKTAQAVRELRSSNEIYRRAAEEIESKINLLEAARPPEPKIRALWDRGTPSPTYILRGGNSAGFGRLVGPGVPSVLTDGRTPFEVTPPWPGARSTGRRLALARWVIQPDHPLTARVMVNRIWRGHFGAGLVRTIANFGLSGERPTHPELLDWLAVEFVRGGWSMKAMHRLIMTSGTYRQSSRITPAAGKVDPENKLLSRMAMRRMEAEVLHDTLLFVAGKLDETRYGFPAPVLVRDDGRVTCIDKDGACRRSIYLLKRRKAMPTLLAAFDYPAMSPNCVQRVESTVAPQALYLQNDSSVRSLSRALAAKVELKGGSSPALRIEHAYWLALSRPPSGEEMKTSLEFLNRLTSQGESAGEALNRLCHTLFNSAAFLYID